MLPVRSHSSPLLRESLVALSRHRWMLLLLFDLNARKESLCCAAGCEGLHAYRKKNGKKRWHVLSFFSPLHDRTSCLPQKQGVEHFRRHRTYQCKRRRERDECSPMGGEEKGSECDTKKTKWTDPLSSFQIHPHTSSTQRERGADRQTDRQTERKKERKKEKGRLSWSFSFLPPNYPVSVRVPSPLLSDLILLVWQQKKREKKRVEGRTNAFLPLSSLKDFGLNLSLEVTSPILFPSFLPAFIHSFIY